MAKNSSDSAIITRIAIDGESAYKQACEGIKNTLKGLDSQMAVVNAQFAKNDTSMEALTARQGILNGRYSEQAQKLEAAKTMLEKYRADGMDPTSDSYQEMERNVNYAQAALIRTEKSLAQITNSMSAGVLATEAYKKSVDGIDRSLSVLDSRLKLVDTKYSENVSSIKAVTEKHSLLSTKLTEEKTKVAEAEKALSALKSEGNASAESISKFEIALNNSQAAVIKTEKEVTKLAKELKQMSVSGLNATKELKAVNDALKINPNSLVLTKQKQEALKLSITDTTQELKRLKQEQSEMKSSKVDKQSAEYRALSREIEITRKNLSNLKAETSTFAPLKAGMAGIHDKLDAFNTKFPIVGKGFKALGVAGEIGFKATTSTIMGATKAFAGYAAAIGGAAVAIGIASGKAAMDVQTSLAKVGTIADTSVMPLKELGNETIALSNKTGVATTELNETLYQAISAGADTASAVGLVEVAVKSAKGGFTDTTTAVDGLTGVINAYGLATTDAEKIANQMLIAQNKGKTTFGDMAKTMGGVIPLAKTAGVATDEFFSATAALTAQIGDTAPAMTGMKAAISNIIKPSETASKTAQQLGLDFSVSALQSKGLSGFLKDLQSTTGGNIDTLGRLFGSTEALNTILALTSKDGMALMDQSMAEMATNTTALEDAFIAIGETPEEQMNRAKNSITNLGVTIGNEFIPMLGDMAAKVSESISSISDGFTAGGLTGGLEALKVEMQGFGEEISASLPGIAQKIGEGLPAVLEGVNGVVLGLIGGLSTSLPTAVNEILPTLTTSFLSLTGGVGAALTENLPTLVDGVTTTVLTLVGGISDAMPTIVTDILPALTNGFFQLVDGLVLELPTLVPTLADGAVTLFLGLVDGLNKTIPLLSEKAPEIISGLTDGLTEHLPDIISGGVQLVVNLAAGAVKGIPELINAIPEITGAIIDGFMDVDWLQTGKDILWGVLDGLCNINEAAWNAIKGVGKQILGIFNNTEDANLAGGASAREFAVGMDKQSKTVENSAKKLKEAASRNLKPDDWALERGVKPAASSISPGIDLDKKSVDNQVAGMFKKDIGVTSLGNSASLAGATTAREFAGGLDKQSKTVEKSAKKLKKTANKNLKPDSDVLEANLTEVISSSLKAAEKQAKSFKEFGKILTDNIKDGMEENQKPLAEAFGKNIDLLAETAQSRYDELLKKKENMESKLLGIGELFTEKDGNFMVNDLSKTLGAMDAYSAKLDKMLKRGAPETLMNEIASMNIQQGSKFAGALNKLSDREFDKYLSNWEKREEKAKALSSKGVAEKLESIEKDYQEGVAAELKALEQEAHLVGLNSGDQLAAGMDKKTEKVEKSAKNLKKAASTNISGDDSSSKGDKKSVAQGVGESAQGDEKDYLKDSAEGVTDKLLETIDGAKPQFVKAGIRLDKYIGEGMADGVGHMTNKVMGLTLAVGEAFEMRDPYFYNIGEAMVWGIGQGVRSQTDWLMQVFLVELNKILMGVQELLQMHSPSRVFAGFGKYMAMGMGDGFVEQMRYSEKDILDSVPTELIENPSPKRLQRTQKQAESQQSAGGKKARAGNGVYVEKMELHVDNKDGIWATRRKSKKAMENVLRGMVPSV